MQGDDGISVVIFVISKFELASPGEEDTHFSDQSVSSPSVTTILQRRHT